jgi:hypothetical protein
MTRHFHARHRQQETRVDAVVAGRDAVAGQHAAFGPGFRGGRPLTQAHDIEHAGNHALGRGRADARRAGHRTNLDALAALGAGIEHFGRACVERPFEGRFAHAKFSIPAAEKNFISLPGRRPARVYPITRILFRSAVVARR